MRRITDVPGLHAHPLSPIAHAVVAGRTCWVSGQLSTDGGAYVPDTPAEEARRAFGLGEAILREAGFAMTEVVFVDIMFADLDDLAEVNAVFADVFPDAPARTVAQAARLPYGGKVKVTLTACKEA